MSEPAHEYVAYDVNEIIQRAGELQTALAKSEEDANVARMMVAVCVLALPLARRQQLLASQDTWLKEKVDALQLAEEVKRLREVLSPEQSKLEAELMHLREVHQLAEAVYLARAEAEMSGDALAAARLMNAEQALFEAVKEKP